MHMIHTGHGCVRYNTVAVVAPWLQTSHDDKRAAPGAQEKQRPDDAEMDTPELTQSQSESLVARLGPEDQARLRPDGLLNPVLPPMTLCGGLESPYLIGNASLDWESPPTPSELQPNEQHAEPLRDGLRIRHSPFDQRVDPNSKDWAVP